MSTVVTTRYVCDGCGKDIDPVLIEAVAPLTLREGSQELHFHDHRCLKPYADRRHGEHMTVVRGHYTKTIEELKQFLATSDDEHVPAPIKRENETQHAWEQRTYTAMDQRAGLPKNREVWTQQLAEAEARLAALDKAMK